MKHEAITLEQREAELHDAYESLDTAAEQWIEARASGHRSRQLDAMLDDAIHVARQADRRYAKTHKRLRHENR